MPDKFWPTIIRFWFFLSYLITTVYFLTFALYIFLHTKVIISFFIQGLSTQNPVKGWKICNTTWYTELTFFISHACLDSIQWSIFTLCIPFIMGWDLFWLIIFSFCAKANYFYEIYHQISVHIFNMYFWKTA